MRHADGLYRILSIPWNYPLLMWAWKIGPAIAVSHSLNDRAPLATRAYPSVTSRPVAQLS